MLKGISDSIKKQHDKKNEQFRDLVLNSSILEKTNGMQQRLNNKQFAQSIADDEYAKNKLKDINIKSANRSYEVPQIFRNINKIQNNEAANNEYLVNKRIFNNTKTNNTEVETDRYFESYRDIDAESKADIMIESLNNILIEKSKQLQNIIDDKGKISSTLSRKNFDIFTNNSSLISTFNSLVRSYNNINLGKSSKSIINNKFIDIEDIVHEIELGIADLIQKDDRQLENQIINLLKTEAVYRTIREMIFNNSYKVINLSDINASFNNVVEDLSYMQQKQLYNKGLINKNIVKSTIKNIDNEIDELFNRTVENFIKIKGREPTQKETDVINNQILKMNKLDIHNKLNLSDVIGNLNESDEDEDKDIREYMKLNDYREIILNKFMEQPKYKTGSDKMRFDISEKVANAGKKALDAMAKQLGIEKIKIIKDKKRDKEYKEEIDLDILRDELFNRYMALDRYGVGASMDEKKDIANRIDMGKKKDLDKMMSDLLKFEKEENETDDESNPIFDEYN